MSDQSSGAANSFIIGNEGSLFDTFKTNGGFAQISDPNVSFIATSDGIVSVGLGGFNDTTERVAMLLQVQPDQLTAFF
ncbi:MAG: hypothetical protein ACJAQT_000869 [Akkermansiaceae bacterium]|jgi:hypothetical protein